MISLVHFLFAKALAACEEQALQLWNDVTGITAGVVQHEVPAQPDEVSCGLRLIMHLKRVTWFDSGLLAVDVRGIAW